MIEERQGRILVTVRVQPKASREAICVERDGRIRVALTAPPVDGAANKALNAYMSKVLGVPKRTITLVSGEKSRDKTLSIEGVSLEQVRRAIMERQAT